MPCVPEMVFPPDLIATRLGDPNLAFSLTPISGPIRTVPSALPARQREAPRHLRRPLA